MDSSNLLLVRVALILQIVACVGLTHVFTIIAFEDPLAIIPAIFCSISGYAGLYYLLKIDEGAQ